MGAWIVIVVAGLTIIMAILVALRPDMRQSREGRVFAFVGLFVLPVISGWFGFEEQMHRAESTRFCLSCHVMDDFGKSLLVDDRSYIPAVHYQNNLVPREEACFTCHTDYAMFGTVQAKLKGMQHVLVQYFGTVPKPEDVKLYEPYNNRECLHCHLESRRYEGVKRHQKTPQMLSDINTNRVSCLSSKCHDTVHDISTLKDATFWKEKTR